MTVPTILALFICIAITVIVLAQADSETVKKDKKTKVIASDRNSQRIDEIASANLIMEEAFQKHMYVLVRKMRQLVTTDDYGYKDYSAWEKEKELLIMRLFPRSEFPFHWNEYDKEMEDALSMAKIDVTDDWAHEFFPDDPSEAHDYIRGYKEEYDALVDRSLPRIFDSFRKKIDKWIKSEKKNLHTAYDESFSGFEYEHFCAQLLVKSGWQAEVTSKSGDQGVDILASKSNTTIVFQCKKYTPPVGNKAVQEAVAGMGYMNADGACVVTNSTFTRSAKELANANGVKLLHHDELCLLDTSTF
jgi:restriction system protein